MSWIRRRYRYAVEIYECDTVGDDGWQRVAKAYPSLLPVWPLSLVRRSEVSHMNTGFAKSDRAAGQAAADWIEKHEAWARGVALVDPTGYPWGRP